MVRVLTDVASLPEGPVREAFLRAAVEGATGRVPDSGEEEWSADDPFRVAGRLLTLASTERDFIGEAAAWLDRLPMRRAEDRHIAERLRRLLLDVEGIVLAT